MTIEDENQNIPNQQLSPELTMMSKEIPKEAIPPKKIGKLLPILLIVVLVMGLLMVIAVVAKKYVKPGGGIIISKPTVTPVRQPTKTVEMPTPIINATVEMQQLNNDLNAINSDIDIIDKEDNRLTPPTFTFDLKIN